MASWFEELMGRQAPAVTPSSTKPTTPVSPFPTLDTSKIREGKWDRRWRRLFKTGVQPGIAEYLQVLLGAVLLDQFGPEQFYPDELLGASNLLLTGAGNKSLAFFNPTSAQQGGVLAVIQLVVVTRTVSAGQVWMGPLPAQPAGGVGLQIGATLDTRAGVFGALHCGLDVSTVANPIMYGVTGISGGIAIPSGINVNPAVYPGPVIVAPGKAFAMAADNAEVINATVIWREKPYE